jgi:hypothetical protein
MLLEYGIELDFFSIFAVQVKLKLFAFSQLVDGRFLRPLSAQGSQGTLTGETNQGVCRKKRPNAASAMLLMGFTVIALVF